ncbi:MULTISPECIES: N-acetylmuramoyl-L-alanine amidase [Pantoea]|uniref:N-acetylmuramoyl-L-alanine amidase n=1 Tax=Pantoea TaxID=53335 RepID=UPI000CE3D859|nr:MULTISPECIES: N-acetylmuramoyl-L-alanine amidase [Pantoea]KAA6103928.1 N-acetylmuramoyl-L-alanine amidase [Pantoea sp. B_9]KAA6116135.1 N-acetylmuramoyl-L-alanine amidase [Pantoea sp. B_10]NIG32962.1 N-acetylmuramoyl-L-alanine amidase [Pantoea sp. Ap-959]PPC70732.1 N-acetylmuramoyl-L-alanine amidase [Pantoea sp. ICBG 828]
MRAVLLLAMALLLSACQSTLEARNGYWVDSAHPAQGARPRIKVVVIHYTAEDFPSSLATLTDRNVSAHYLIPQQPPQKNGAGVIWQLVPENQLAWHAGPSFWRGATRINDTSIGIEIVNDGYRRTLTGRQWQPFTAAQITALIALVRDISQRYGISPENIVGHSDIAPQRKQDPGPLFPWQQLARQGLGAWPDAATVQRYLANQPPDAPVECAALLTALQRYGYDVAAAQTPQMQRKLIAAFQMHFRPRDYRGEADAETLAIARALLAKYGAAQ